MHVRSLVITSPQSNCIIVQYTIARSMALELSCKGNLSEAFSMNRVAAEDNTLNLTNDVDSLI